MSEKLHQPRNPEPHESSPRDDDWYPTEEQLQEFENLPHISFDEKIEAFAKDPENPTDAELREMDEYNRRVRIPFISFEEHFGRPDPRGKAGEQARRREAELQQGDWYPSEDEIEFFEEHIRPVGFTFEQNFGVPRRDQGASDVHPSADDHGNQQHDP